MLLDLRDDKSKMLSMVCSKMEIGEEESDLEEELCLKTCYVNQGTRN